ncbi:MAG TPA: glycosyl hydrolase family 28 protein [Phycisphaerae bacterium]|nr:glycosyl hydrolase family 28 protein [Phycisphaerae bacterium]
MLACMLCLAGFSLARGAVVTYSAPRGEKASEDYAVRAGGRPVFVYTASVLRGGPASFAYFDFSGSVIVTVAVARKIDAVKILPTSYGIQPVFSGNRISFRLSKPANLTIELNGSIERPLHLFANPPDVRPRGPANKDVIYFGPGVHEVTTLRPQSGQTIYLAGGAILRAKLPPDEKPREEKSWAGTKIYAPLIETDGAKGVTVRGRGILDLGPLPWHARAAMWFGNSEDILVEGIIILDAPQWVVAMQSSKNVVVRNVKQICARENSDGVDICNSQDVLVEDCFLRNNDDGVCVKTFLPPPAMKSMNIVVRRCVVWNERARGLGITCETRADISNVLFQDCDIIHDWGASLAILVSDSGTMSDILFEDIRCEDVRDTLVYCQIMADMWGRDPTRGHIKGVTFRDIRVTGKTFPVSKLLGFDETHLVEDVTFERLRIHGKLIGDAQAARLQTNAHVRRVNFITSSGRPQAGAGHAWSSGDRILNLFAPWGWLPASSAAALGPGGLPVPYPVPQASGWARDRDRKAG